MKNVWLQDCWGMFAQRGAESNAPLRLSVGLGSASKVICPE
jgi:hypothetical protein